MSYMKRHLANGEHLVREAKFHWTDYLFALILSPLIVGIVWLIRMWTTEMAVTNKRVIYKVGWIARRTEEINVNRIEELNVKQSILGRILGYGSIFMRGTGGSSISLRKISRPGKFQQSINQVTT